MLSRYPSLLVIARNSSFSYKGIDVNVQRVGRELGVRYVLEGSVRKVDAHVRVTSELVETDSWTHIWANRYDADVTDIFAVQDEITHAVSTAIARPSPTPNVIVRCGDDPTTMTAGAPTNAACGT